MELVSSVGLGHHLFITFYGAKMSVLYQPCSQLKPRLNRDLVSKILAIPPTEIERMELL